MLEKPDPPEWRELIERVPCHLTMTSEVERLLALRGVAPPLADEVRIAPRYRLFRRAALVVTDPLPAVSRAPDKLQAWVFNRSRQALGLLFHEQLYPDERLHLEMFTDEVDGFVVRCRRFVPGCFEVGVILDKPVRLRDILG